MSISHFVNKFNERFHISIKGAYLGMFAPGAPPLNQFEDSFAVLRSRTGKTLQLVEKESKLPYSLLVLQKYSFGNTTLESLYRQVESLQSISHPILAPIQQIYKFPEKSLSILTTCYPHTLSDYLPRLESGKEKFGLDPTQFAKIIFGIAAGMKFLHAKGVVNGGLMVDNIFLDENFEPHIALFGLHIIYSTKLWLDKLDLKLHMFLAPELINDPKMPPNMKTDVYAFGIIIHRLLSNELIFRKKPEFPGFAANIAAGNRLRPFINATPFLRTLMNRCWEIKPENRPTFDEIISLILDNMPYFFVRKNVEEVDRYVKQLMLFNEESSESSSKNDSFDLNIPQIRKRDLTKFHTIVTLQTLLINLSDDEGLSEIIDFINIHKFTTKHVNSFIRNLFMASTCRFMQIELYAKLVKELDVPGLPTRIFQEIVHSISVGNPVPNELPKVALMRHMVLIDLVSLDILMAIIDTFIKMEKFSCSLFLLFSYFAPQIEEMHPELYVQITEKYRKESKKPFFPRPLKVFWKRLKSLQEDNWTKYYESINLALDRNRVENVIRRDDLETFRQLLQQSKVFRNTRIKPNIHVPCIWAQQFPPIPMYAALFGAKKIFQELQLRNAPMGTHDAAHRSVMMTAVASGNIDIYRFLEESNEDPDSILQTAIIFHQNQIFSEIRKDHPNLYVPDRCGNLCITIASEVGNIQMLLYCLQNGIPADSREAFGWTPLHAAARHNQKDAMKVLLAVEGNNCNVCDSWGNTPLHVAVEYGHVDIVKMLLKRENVNVNAQTEDGKTPLHVATESGNLDIVSILLAVGAVNVNAQTAKLRTPLHLAVRRGFDEIVSLLVVCKEVNLRSVDNKGKTPYDLAVELGNLRLLEGFQITKRRRRRTSEPCFVF